ncbi:flavin reductase family protein [Pseudooceanicola aestuarii]|uniref:flavin reductase family protein n=1 Tax=Pseudooceanicola aestuarii TaxID=2697319 RepID=UPI0013D3CE0D|nr:flavin reductase family protein [Pseudooceanicola aestuarii]
MSLSVEDQKALRGTLGQFPTGVCLITCISGGEKLGMTMTSFNSLSLTPPLILFSIDKRARGLPQWQKAEGYAVHILAATQQDLSNRFARPGDKWAGVAHDTGLHDAPLIPGVTAVMECGAYRVEDTGDHLLFIAQIERHSSNPDRDPLVFARGRYAALGTGERADTGWPLAIHY